jgi:hypothetical protein
MRDGRTYLQLEICIGGRLLDILSFILARLPAMIVVLYPQLLRCLLILFSYHEDRLLVATRDFRVRSWLSYKGIL